jgi:hypothetical protein
MIGEPNPDLSRLARRAYELGRLKLAGLEGLVTVPLAIAGAGCCALGHASVVVGGIALYGAFVLARWRGGGWGRGAYPGLIAGAIAFAIAYAGCLVLDAPMLRLGACLLGGLLAGVGLGVRAARVMARDRGPFLFAAGGLAALAGAVGCVFAGAGGILGVAAGVAVATAPPLLVALRAQR